MKAGPKSPNYESPSRKESIPLPVDPSLIQSQYNRVNYAQSGYGYPYSYGGFRSQPAVTDYSYLNSNPQHYSIPQQVELHKWPEPLKDLYQVSSPAPQAQTAEFLSSSAKPSASVPTVAADNLKKEATAIAEKALTAPAKAAATENAPNILMRKPFRYMGFLNEYAEMLHGIIPPSLYKFLWLAELGYVGSEAALSGTLAGKKAKLDKSAVSPASIGAREFVGRGLFHSMATIAVPTLMISGLNSPGISHILKKEQTGIMGGLKGLSEQVLTKMKMPKWGVKYGSAAAVFAALPLLVKTFDPMMERFVEKTIHKFLPTQPVAKAAPQAEGASKV